MALAGVLALIVVYVAWNLLDKKVGAPTVDIPQSQTDSLRVEGDEVVIDFATCVPGKSRVDVAFGSTTIQITSKEKDACMIMYGGEVENPNWDGKLDTTCRVPVSLGRATFAKGSTGVDLSAIGQYCS